MDVRAVWNFDNGDIGAWHILVKGEIVFNTEFEFEARGFLIEQKKRHPYDEAHLEYITVDPDTAMARG